jgi:hypothetical protein
MLLLLVAAATGWLGFEAATALLSATGGVPLAPGALRGAGFTLLMLALTAGLLWLAVRVSLDQIVATCCASPRRSDAIRPAAAQSQPA